MSDFNSPIYEADVDLFEGVPIISYSRKMMIADGEQMLFEGDDAQAFSDVGYKYPVFVTRSVIGLIETALKANEFANKNTIVNDLAWMSRMCKVSEGYDYAQFKCILPTHANPTEGEELDFYIQVGATDIDDPAPCMTLMTSDDR